MYGGGRGGRFLVLGIRNFKRVTHFMIRREVMYDGHYTFSDSKCKIKRELDYLRELGILLSEFRAISIIIQSYQISERSLQLFNHVRLVS